MAVAYVKHFLSHATELTKFEDDNVLEVAEVEWDSPIDVVAVDLKAGELG